MNVHAIHPVAFTYLDRGPEIFEMSVEIVQVELTVRAEVYDNFPVLAGLDSVRGILDRQRAQGLNRC